MQTQSNANENFKKLAELFPSAITETIDSNGEITRAIDRDILMQEISEKVVDGNEERYQFTWPDKKKSILMANTSITGALRPCRSESMNFDDTENIYIEGDNLEVLKLMRETYLGKVKMIYIDPPYNTGNDFVYEDDFSQSVDEYLANSGQYDTDGNRLVKNLESSGRFHTDWLNMIYPRLKVARDFLSEDGSIFISIDNVERDNLKKICDEIFGVDDFIADIVWKRKRGRDNSAKWFSKAHEYCLVYARNKEKFNTGYLAMDNETRKAYKNPDNDPRGDYRMLGCWARGTQGGVRYEFTTNEGQVFEERLWLFSEKNLKKLEEEKKLIIRGDNVYRKMFLYENKGKIPETLWDDVSNAANASDEIKKLFDGIVFDTPKPTPYIRRMIEIATNKNDIVLDFFSGSATTANAVMTLNAEDGGERKFILVQLPEVISTNSNALNAGYKNICEIGKERIRRAGRKIKEENKDKEDIENLDVGFRVLKCDSSNMKDVYYSPADYDEGLFSSLTDNIKEGRTSEDLLFQVMLDLGVMLSSKIEESIIDGKKVFDVSEGSIMACFDDNVTEATIMTIAQKTPERFVMRDSSMANDSVAANFEQIFATYSPETIITVL